MGKRTARPKPPAPRSVPAPFARKVLAAQRELASEIARAAEQSPDLPFAALLAGAAVRLASNHGLGRDEVVELAKQLPEHGYEYRPLPAFGTGEFAAELERRHRQPGRALTAAESLADEDDA